MANSRPIEKTYLYNYLIILIKNIEPQQNDRQSAVLDYMEKTIALQERIASLLEDKAELQVDLERAMMNIERRDMRIRELEKENAFSARAASIQSRRFPAVLFFAFLGFSPRKFVNVATYNVIFPQD